MKDKKNIVFVSISNDLYGSSKVLLSLVLKMKKESSDFYPIVCLPIEEGPLKEVLMENDIKIIEMPIVKLTRSMLRFFKIFSILKEYFKAKKIFKRETLGKEIACIHSNTLATLFGSFFCVFNKPKHIIHVHEIMDRPWFVKYFFATIMLLFSNKIVYNSFATEKFFNKTCPLLKKKSITILNGVDRDSNSLSKKERRELRLEIFKANEENFLIGLVGRFNRLKGHNLLLESFKDLSLKFSNIKLCFVGSSPKNQDFYYFSIINRIEELQLKNKVEIIGFQKNIYPILDALDVIIVPSTEPESFGIIAVEAMLSHRAVIASEIGGIPNFITHNETGILFEPNNKEQLNKALERVITNSNLKEELEENAYKKCIYSLSTDMMFSKFTSVYNSIT